VHAQRYLPVHHGTVPVLPGEQAGLAELDPAQPEPERVFRQAAARRQETGQG